MPACLGGKIGSALSSAAGQYVSAAFGAHSFTEAVHFFLVSFFRLIGSFHIRFSC